MQEAAEMIIDEITKVSNRLLMLLSPVWRGGDKGRDVDRDVKCQ